MSATTTRRPTLALVCSPGGHLAELLALSEAFADCEVVYFCYDADTTRRLPGAMLVPNKPYNPLRHGWNFLKLWRLFRRQRPDAVISTGAEIALPAFALARIMGIPSLYIECGAQVITPSLTGRIVIHLASEFYVQWPELVEGYGGKARYRGSLIDDTPPEGSE